MVLQVPRAPAPPPDVGSLPRKPRITARGRWSVARIPTRSWLAPSVLGVCLLGLWAGATQFGGIAPFVLPSPGAVLAALRAGLIDGSLLSAAGITLLESLSGFALGAAIALPIGYAIARSPWIAATLQPYVAASQALPAVALAPLFIVWLGFGLPPTAALAALIVFFPAAITTTLGVRTLDRDVLDAARVDGASGWQLLSAIELPLALPAVLAGLRTSLTLSVTGAVVGEFVLGGIGTGLGSLSTQALNHLDTAQLFAVLIVLGAMAAVLYGIARLIERRISYVEGN
jgi:NitT/TauT family transport system permease protein